ncbi:MAG: sensor domain-containing diguanylate cyclase [Chitinophagia bacterium]|nr:sensor domain-containing diguanylate cyclase [Chitinophagia bacterium]
MRRNARNSKVNLRKIIRLQALLGSAEFDLPAFMEMVAEQVKILTDATSVIIELRDGNKTVYKIVKGTLADLGGLEGNISNLCIKKADILIFEDTSKDPRINAKASRKLKVASMVVVPLFRQGKAVGVLKVISKSINAFDIEDIKTLQLLAGLLGGALGQQVEMEKRLQLEEKLRHIAEFDSLTNLPNRELFYDRLTHALKLSARHNHLLALMYMDIDHFKKINDTYGHAAGDKVLQIFASRVKAATRESDTFARLSGDEFILLLENIQNKNDVVIIINKIFKSVGNEFKIGRKIIKLKLSVGIITFSGKGNNAEMLIKHADKALYKAKQSGRDNFKFYIP